MVRRPHLARHTTAAAVGLLVAACTAPSEAPATLQFSYGESAGYPVAALLVRAGPTGELALDGASFRPAQGSYVSDSLALPPATGWPVTLTMLRAPTDTATSTNLTIDLASGHLTTVSIFVRRDLVGLFVCAPIIARAPIAVAGSAPDTLYVLSWGPAAPGAQFPVC